MKFYAVIDTNVIVSALLKWNSVPGVVLQAVFNGFVVPVYNDEILNEYRNVLNRPKIRFFFRVDFRNHIPDRILGCYGKCFGNCCRSHARSKGHCLLFHCAFSWQNSRNASCNGECQAFPCKSDCRHAATDVGYSVHVVKTPAFFTRGRGF